MIYLIIVSLLWAPSFGLVGHYLKGVDANFVAAARVVLSLVVFLPLMRLKGISFPRLLALAGIGALQFGAMYVLYIHAFAWIAAPEVALFTIFTPLLVTLFDDLFERRVSWMFLAMATLAVIGTGIIQWTTLGTRGVLVGFGLMQLSNGCFALGQVLYRRVSPAAKGRDHEVMAILYLGAAIVAGAAAATSLDIDKLRLLSSTQWLVLLYLGAIASGVGFFLFNAGARMADIGALAICNNLKVPLAILASAWLFHDHVNWPRLLIGGSLIGAALAINECAVARKRT